MPRLRDLVPGPEADAFALLFLPPVLSLVYPALYLPASILILLTPARNSASLLAPPPSLFSTVTMTLTTSAVSTPRWTLCKRTTVRGPLSPHRRHPRQPERGGRGAEYSVLSLLGSHSHSVVPRLVIPAGILQISVFSVLVALFYWNHDSCSAGTFLEPPQKSCLFGAYVGCYVGNEFVKKKNISTLRYVDTILLLLPLPMLPPLSLLMPLPLSLPPLLLSLSPLLQGAVLIKNLKNKF